VTGRDRRLQGIVLRATVEPLRVLERSHATLNLRGVPQRTILVRQQDRRTIAAPCPGGSLRIGIAACRLLSGRLARLGARLLCDYERRDRISTTCPEEVSDPGGAMRTWWRRIKAGIGMGLVWGVVWSGAGALLARMPGFYSDLPFPLLFAPLGFATGIIFSGILVAIEGRRGFARTSLWRFAAWGAASGLLLSGVFVVGAALRGQALWGEFLLFGPPLTAAGAVCAAGSLAVARRAGRRELPEDDGPDLLQGGD
jgi:hypothetical protein